MIIETKSGVGEAPDYLEICSGREKIFVPRNYQPIKNNPYWLPHNLYMRVLYIIRDYPRMISEQNAVIYTTPEKHKGTKNQHGDPTANKATKLAMMSSETDAIDFALHDIPVEYRSAIWDNILYDIPYKVPANKNTFRYWRSKFCYSIAERLYYI